MQDCLYSLATDRRKGLIPAFIKIFLFILSLLYRFIVFLLVFFSQSFRKRVNCKVVSIGNITLGGTGKTSLTEFVARFFFSGGSKVVILSRGYKSSGRQLDNYDEQKATSRQMGDEPYMLSKKLSGVPVLVDKNRFRSANKAINDFKADIVILDDGFQQWRIKKDLDIVCIDSINPFGNKHLIPRGILREPLSSLKRANIFILTKTDLSKGKVATIRNELKKLNSKALIVESEHKPLGFYSIDHAKESFSLQDLKAKTVALFCAIGDPESFKNLIACLDIKVGLFFAFRDHYNYSPEDLDNIIKESRDNNIDTIITTEKDAVRFNDLRLPIADIRILVMPIELKITVNEQEFYDRLRHL